MCRCVAVSFILIFLKTISAATSVWVETSQSDFNDGEFESNIYASYRNGGAVEFTCRFDVNNDNWLDVCCSDGYGDSLRIYYGSASGFLPGEKFVVRIPGGGECAVADLNLDGYSDLIHTGWRARSSAAIYWGSATGPIPSNPRYLPVPDCEALFIADLDRDGWLDLTFSSENDTVYIYWGGETGYSTSRVSKVPLGGEIGHNFAVADVDRDGCYELFACRIKYATTQPIIRFEHNRNWSVSWLDFTTNGFDPHGVTVADFNCDDWLDVVYSGHNDISEAWIYFGSDSGFRNNSRTVINPGPSLGGSAACDFNGDGLPDLIFFRGSYYPPSQFQPVIFYNTGMPPWFSDSNQALVGVNRFNSSGGMVADFNQDGYYDIFTNNFGGEVSYVFWGPDWQTLTPLPCNRDHHSFARQPGNVYDRSYHEEYISSVFDAGGTVRWQQIFWDDTTPGNAVVLMAVRTGFTPIPDSSWTEWLELNKGDFIPDSMAARYIQYRALLTDANPACLPMLYEVRIEYGSSVRRDVGVRRIIVPGDTVDSGMVIEPVAEVANYGSEPADFTVLMRIGTGYSAIESLSLSPGAVDTVEFEPWIAEPVSSVPLLCFTTLASDENRANDTARKVVYVKRAIVHDVGTVDITAPAVVLRAGDTVVPQAIIRNLGNFTERFFDVRFRIGDVYTHTVTVNTALLPDSVVALAFPVWIAAPGSYTVSCSTMLVNDNNPQNDRYTRNITVTGSAFLRIEPDQTDRMELGEKKGYGYYAYLERDSGAVVELKLSNPPLGWAVQLFDSANFMPLIDTDGDGLSDLGFVSSNRRSHFTLRVAAPTGLTGDTGIFDTVRLVITGFLSADSLVRDSTLLKIKLVPRLAIHNYPNPLDNQTTFVIGVPEDGKLTLTVFNRAGERICCLIQNEPYSAGVHLINWDTKNDLNQPVGPGTYHYLLEFQTGDRVMRIQKKLVKR